jgi:hypothetical protein
VRRLYNVHAVGFTVASALLVSSVALAALGFISAQAALIAGGALWFVRGAILKNLEIYELTPRAFLYTIRHALRPTGDEQIAELWLNWRRHPPAPEWERGRQYQAYELVRGVAEFPLYRREQILDNTGLNIAHATDWDPAPLRICGVPLALAPLPSTPPLAAAVARLAAIREERRL